MEKKNVNSKKNIIETFSEDNVTEKRCPFRAFVYCNKECAWFEDENCVIINVSKHLKKLII